MTLTAQRHAKQPTLQELDVLNDLLRHGRYPAAEAEARALAKQHPGNGGVLGILALARQASAPAAGAAAGDPAAEHAAPLREATSAVTAERVAALQAGGLDAVPALWITGLPAGYDDMVSGGAALVTRYAEALLGERGGLERYVSELTPEQCRVDAKACLDAFGHDGRTRPYPQPLAPGYLGLIGLWFPRAPVVFCRYAVLDSGLAAYLEQPARRNADDHASRAVLYALGEQLAEREQAMQHWARVLPNPIYWVDAEELVTAPGTVARRLASALPAACQPEEAAVREALLPAPASETASISGLAQAFEAHLTPLLEGYQAAMEAQGFPAQSIEGFDWQIQGRVVAVDNAARLPRENGFAELMSTNAFAVVAFDPASRVAANSLGEIEEFQYVPHALLGDGNPGMLHATLDAALSSPLEPLPAEQLPPSLRDGARVLTRLPINTLRLDDIEGLASLDWLILDELADASAVLENGVQALADTLLLQVGIAFSPTHARQPNLAEISHWACRHGFAFYRLNNLRHRSLLSEREDIARPQATQLASADALFIPSPERLAELDDSQRKRLAFVLDAVFGIHDLSYQLLAEMDASLAERYLKARGYVGVHRTSEAANPPSLFAVKKVERKAERALAAVLADHNSQRALGQARQLLKDHPDDPEGRYYLGQALSQLGRHDQASAELASLYDDVPALRYGLALGEAQYRAGNNKAVRRIAEKLAERHPEHLAVVRLALLPALTSHKRRELNVALERCQTLLDHSDSALVAAGLGDAVSARAECLHLAACFEQVLAKDAEAKTQAVVAHEQALEALGSREGPLRAQLLIALAEAQRDAGDPESAVATLWQACMTQPRSLHTAAANAKLRDALAQSPNAKHQQLATLHAKLHSVWREYGGKALNASRGDYGLPLQGLESLMLAGIRPAQARLERYGLKDLLPPDATALDVGCDQGFLLLALADVLSTATGIDSRKPSVVAGNAVAEYLGHAHIQLHHKTFSDYTSEQRFDLIIASAVHQQENLPEEDIGGALTRLCKPGGIVLLESQGIRERQRVEPGFVDKATAIASAGFSVLRKGSLCDDGTNYREFWLLKREGGLQATPKPCAGKARASRLPMIEGDAAVVQPMQAICRTLAEEGAWFNPDLRIHAANGNLSLFGTPGAARACYMRVPLAIMPQLEGFDVSSRGGKLVAIPSGVPLLPRQEEMMEAMLALYNATNKLSLWRESLPFLAWQKTPKVLDYLVRARVHDGNMLRYQKHYQDGENDTLLVDSFIGSRRFNLTAEHLVAMGVKGKVDRRHVLMPLVDCLNHRLSAEGFNTPLVDGKPNMRTFHEPAVDTGELFVRYNLYDAVDTILSYGFMDAACSWLSSVPVTLSVSGQTLKVQGVPMMLRGLLPAAFEDIREYMPALHRQGEHKASVTKLMLCTENPHSLRRVLTYLVYTLGIAHTDFVARQQVAELERQLIEQNRQWWQGLNELTAELSADHPARQLCRHSLEIIRRVEEQLQLR